MNKKMKKGLAIVLALVMDKNYITKKIITCLLAVVLCFSTFIPIGSDSYAYAEESNTATVIFKSTMISAAAPYTLEVKDQNGTVYEGTKRAGSSGSQEFEIVYTLPIKKAESYYTYSFIPEDTDKYWGSNGKFYVYQNMSFDGLNLSDGGGFYVFEKETIDVEIPTGSTITHGVRGKFYHELQESSATYIETADGYDKYRLKVPVSYGSVVGHFEIRKDGYVTWAGYNTDLKLVSEATEETPALYRLEELKSGNETIDRDEKNQGFYEAGILLNGPTDKFIELSTGEYFDIYAFRAWQAIDSETGNYYVDPDFRYEVVDGDSVTVDDEGRITAVKDGVSIVKVSYDALEWTSSRLGRMVYSACWPEKQGVYVVNVNGKDSDAIDTGIKLNEYDTVYYLASQDGVSTGIDHAEYTFTPTSTNNQDIKVEVKSPTISGNNISYGEWVSYDANKNGSYTVKLYKGRNVIKVSAGDAEAYHVVAADDLDIEISNKYRPGEELMVGDRAVITLNGLTTPIPKMGAIYNPSGYSTVYSYDGSKIETFIGQYDLSRNAKVEVDLTESGIAVLTDGCLNTSVWGDDSGAFTTHQRMQKGGVVLNGNTWNGGDNDLLDAGGLCVLPNIKFQVKDDAEIEESEKLKAGLLTSIKFGTGEEIYASLFGSTASDDALAKGKNNFIARAIMQASQLNGKPLYIQATAKNPNAKITVHCKNDKNQEKTVEIVSGVSTQITTANEKFLGTTDSKSNITEIEITVDPGTDGYKRTYAFAMGAAVQIGKNVAYLDSFEISAVDDEFSTGEVLFEAKADEAENIGYGFLMTRTSHDVRIPARINKIIATYALTGEDGTTYNAGDEITLNDGDNVFTAVAKPKSGSATSKTYTFNFIKESTQQVSFNAADDVKLNVRNARGRVVSGEEGNIYNLPAGTYTYAAEKSGYITQTGSFEVVAGEDKQVTLSAFTKVPAQSGNVSVSIIGENSYVKQKTTVAVSEPADLASQRYVEYNYGGYTALHAMIDALNNGVNKAEFRCIKGELVPITDTTGSSITSYSDWICEINGKLCTDPANTLVNDGDVIEYYYNAAYEGMQHAVFAEGVQKTITAGSDLNLTLLSKAVGTDDEKTACADAKILINGQDKGITTDANGKAVIPTALINTPDQYTITAQKLNGENQNILTYAAYILTVKKADSQQQTGKTTVSFRLIGDAVHDGISEHGSYVTWIATKEYTFNKDSVSVYEVFMKALKDAGLQQDGADSNYVKSIKAPTAYGGYWLSEFTNGQNSGWMYTVNGEHPEFGLKDYYVTNGDSIVWHYVDDYKLETSFEGSIATYPNRWLEAEDINPPTDKVVDMSGGNKEEVKEVTSDKSAATTTSPTDVKLSETTNADGTKERVATATVSSDNQKEILAQAKSNKSKEIILQVSKDSVKDATKVDVQLDKSFIESVAATGASLTVKTPLGDKTYTNAELKELAAAASGKTASIEIVKSAEQADDEAKLAQAKELVGKMSLIARSSKTAKKNIKVTLKMSKATASAISELKDLGYTVKYKFYRSTKKSSKYVGKLTKQTKTYTNTEGTKGTRYYYKARVQVFDKEGKLVAQTALKQCKYACRQWTK